MKDYYADFLEKNRKNVSVYEVSKVSKATKRPFDTFDTKQTNTNSQNFSPAEIEPRNEAAQLREYNQFVELYNHTVDLILSDSDLFAEFETILDERKAILMIDGEVSEADAESYVRQPETLKRAAMLFMQN